MRSVDYKETYDAYWSLPSREGESSGDLDGLAELVAETCGLGRALDVGSGEGSMVGALLEKGFDAHGIDVSTVVVQRANRYWPGRFLEGSVLSMPYPDEHFDVVVSTDCLEHLAPEDVATAMREIHRVSRRYVFLQIATKPDRDGKWHLTVENREWWETLCMEAGFRKHALYYDVNPYESLNHDDWQIRIVLEKVPPQASARFGLAVLDEGRLLHNDMLRIVGRRSDAHCIRYHEAARFIRPGDRVLDVACGLGYGSHILFSASQAQSVLGVDLSEHGIVYANAHYGRPGAVEFRVGDAQMLSEIPDHSIDFIAAFETIEHVPDPDAYLRELRRVLKPSGRVMVSAPNYWADETGKDPNPHHLHVYTWDRLKEQCSRYFMPERGFLQTAGGAMKCANSQRMWMEISASEEVHQDAEWILLLCISDPIAGAGIPYEETAWRLPGDADFNVAAFGRDYQNPWLVRGMVAIGMRTTSDTLLGQFQQRVLSMSLPGSVDYGAALCGHIYRLTASRRVDEAGYGAATSDVRRYVAINRPNPHQIRWQVSLLFAAGELASQLGIAEDARFFYEACAAMDATAYSPLLANKTLDALHRLACMEISRHDAARAGHYLHQAVKEAQRVVQSPWINVIGSSEAPLTFGLPELTQILDKASRAVYMLSALSQPAARSGMLYRMSRGFFEKQLLTQKISLDRLSQTVRALQNELSGRDEQIARNHLALTGFDSRVVELGRAVAARDADYAHLHQELLRRDVHISQLLCVVTEREERLSGLTQASRALEIRASQLSLVLDERETRLSRLTEVLAERDDQLSQLSRVLGERDIQLSQLGQVMSSRDREIDHLRIESSAIFQRLDRLVSSKSWALTRPFRAITRLVRNGHLDEDGRVGVIPLARLAGRKLPVPLKLKVKIREALLAKQHRHPPKTGARQAPARLESGLEGPGDAASAAFMRPECCALIPHLVSVVLPVYNHADLAGESIDSVLAQTYKNFELIIIDDGSIDGIEHVLRRYLNHPRVRCYTQRNQKLPKALSNGFGYARGEFWTWTSADNIMDPRMLERLVAKLSTHPRLGLVYADYYAIDDSGALLQDRAWRAHNRPHPESGEVRLPRNTAPLNVVQDNFIGPCFMYRGWIGRLFRDYDPQLGIEDYDYWMRINAFFPIEHLGTPDLLYRYRVHENTLSARAHEHRILEKGQKLMGYEKQRAAFYKTSFVAMADAQSVRWLEGMGLPASSIRPTNDWPSLSIPGENQAVDAVVMSSETALRNLDLAASQPRPIVVLFDSEDIRHQALQRLLNKKHCAAFVRDARTAERIRLVSDCTVLDLDAQGALPALVAFAKNYRFLEMTRSSQEMQRHTPQPLLQPRERHVLAQVDGFTQGGMENVVIDLCLSLKESGYRVTILNLGKSGDAVNKAREHGLRVECTGFKSGSEYTRWLKSEKVELVNAHYSIYGAQVCQDLGIPYIETIHNSYVWFEPPAIAAYRDADAFIGAYLCVSKTAAQYADTVLGLDVAKMHVVPNGISAGNIDARNFSKNRKRLRAEWGDGPESPVFLNVASIMATKAQLPLVRAFSQVVKTLANAKLVLLGSAMEPSYRQAVEEAIVSLKLERHVILSGYHRDVASYYHAADVFVLPSYWEGWSLSLGEAMANGLPCVITNVGSAYEFDGMPGVHIVTPPFNDITELNFSNLGSVVYGEDAAFEARLARAMIDAARHERGPVDVGLAQRLDRTHAYRAYAAIFSQAINQAKRQVDIQ